MFKKHSVTNRIFIGLLVGLTYGIIILILAPLFNFAPISMLGFGTLLFFAMMGFTIGLVGIFDYHPIFGFKMRWWIRGIVGGFIFGLMYVLVGYTSIIPIMQSNLMVHFGLSSPFWALTDYVLAGLIIALFETKLAGDGSRLPLK